MGQKTQDAKAHSDPLLRVPQGYSQGVGRALVLSACGPSKLTNYHGL